MKKNILGAILLGILSTSVLNAGMWSTATSLLKEEVKPTAAYTLDTSGYNPRVYEFFTKDKRMKCVVIFSSSSKSSNPTMQCIKLNSLR